VDQFRCIRDRAGREPLATASQVRAHGTRTAPCRCETRGRCSAGSAPEEKLPRGGALPRAVPASFAGSPASPLGAPTRPSPSRTPCRLVREAAGSRRASIGWLAEFTTEGSTLVSVLCNMGPHPAGVNTRSPLSDSTRQPVGRRSTPAWRGPVRRRPDPSSGRLPTISSNYRPLHPHHFALGRFPSRFPEDLAQSSPFP
jgi:hypothetical protein